MWNAVLDRPKAAPAAARDLPLLLVARARRGAAWAEQARNFCSEGGNLRMQPDANGAQAGAVTAIIDEWGARHAI
jgi:hypothetical protein